MGVEKRTIGQRQNRKTKELSFSQSKQQAPINPPPPPPPQTATSLIRTKKVRGKLV